MQLPAKTAGAAVAASRRMRTLTSAINLRTEPAASVLQSGVKISERYPLVSKKQQFTELRKRACKELLAGGLIYLESGAQLIRNGYDVHHKFRVDSNFLYLTGVEEPDFSCLIDAETGDLTLLAPKMPPEAAYWVGGLPSLEELAEEYGASRCAYTEDLASLVKANGRGRDVHTLPSLADKLATTLHAPRPSTSKSSSSSSSSSSTESGSDSSSVSSSSASSSSGIVGAPRVMDAFLEDVLKRCRAVKTDAEVACTLQANRVSGQAHMDMWRACRPGMYEYQLEAVFTGSTLGGGARQLGYPCIVGAGTNSAVLHYGTNSCRAQAQDLVLVDAGAEVRCYTADITRTFPASGTFSGAQRDVYNAVLAAQEHALSQLRAGRGMKDVEHGARMVLLEHMRGMGLVTGSTEALKEAKVDRIFMPHGLGHFLGLDVHDVSDVGPVPKILKPGHMVTVEPGLYFIPSLIKKAAQDPVVAPLLNLERIEQFQVMGGVRIEDNVVVLEDGSLFNITMEAGVLKQASDIEEVMRAARG